MPLDESTRRFAFLMQRDLRRLEERRAGREARGEAMRTDSAARMATWETKHGEVTARQYTEVLATYEPRDRILRWGWAGRSPSASASHGDVIVREAQARGVPQLAMSVVADLDAEDAEELARIGAILARAEAFVSRKKVGGGSEIEFVGLFDRAQPEARYSVPPPPVEPSHASPVPPRATPPPPYRSLPPVREVYAPRTTRNEDRGTGPSRSSPPPRPRAGSVRPPPAATGSTRPDSESASATARGPVREPSRTLFVPVANTAIRALASGCPGYQQGLFVVTVSNAARPDQPRRVVVQLVAVDGEGVLRALDPPRELVEAAAEMTDADRREGSRIWRKLAARILPKPDGGATLHVDVT